MRVAFVLASLMAGSALAQEAAPPGDAAPSGELGVQLGYAWGNDAEGITHGGPGVRLHLLEQLGPYFAVGPEAAVYRNAGSRMNISWDGRTHHESLTTRPLLQLGGVARAGLVLGRVRPSVTLGVGWYKGVISNLGFSVGTEVEARLADWLSLFADARIHGNLHNFSYEGSPGQEYLSLGLGSRLMW